MLPSAPIYTTYFDARVFRDRLDSARVRTWPLSGVGGSAKGFRRMYPVYAAYFDRLRIEADLVVSSSIAFAKAIRTRPDSDHVAYVYTPMRYAWDLDAYLARSSYSLPARLGARLLRPAMQAWDRGTARRPSALVAISHEVRRRIERHWKLAVEEVIYPPVPTAEIPFGLRDEGYFLVSARLLGYRRVDLAVEACTRLGRRLIVTGEGPELARLRHLAGPSVDFLGRVDRAQLMELYAGAHAYILPGAEDFGIAPVEAMAAGKPVVAYGAGGALETVDPGRTGVHFPAPTVESLMDAIAELERTRWKPSVIRAHAERFDVSVFRHRWRSLLAARGHAGLLAENQESSGA